MQTPTKQQGAKIPESQPRNGGNGGKKGTQGAAPKRKPNKRGEPRRTPDQPKPRQFSSPGASLGLRCSLGGDISAFGSCPPPGCAAHPFRMAAVLDGVPEHGVVPHHHAAPFAMSSMRLSAAASGFRRISSQMALETWPVWVVWLNLNLGTFWSTMETSRNGAEGSTLQPLLHPAVVEALRRLVQHQLQDGLAGPDLEEAGAPSPTRQYPLQHLHM